MKKLLVILPLIFLLVLGCKKDTQTLDEGVITGPDQRLCMCCGGWFINIGDDTYRFKVLPEGSMDPAEMEFPFEVYVNWELDINGCFEDEIIIFEIQK